MTDEIARAFAHPLARAKAEPAGQAPRDRISVRDYITEVEIGAFQSERGTTQRLRFNLVVELLGAEGPVEDDVDRILSYDLLTEAIEQELAAERLNLLETLAERVAARILLAPQAERVFVRIEKLDRGPGALGVEIVRSHADAAPAPAPGAAAQPIIVYLAQTALDGPALAVWLDHCAASAAPVILCLGPAGLPAPQAADPLAQRRIDLLAIEQNAWLLAGRDPRCVVTDSRTELDWGLKHRQISVWAPSRIVLDTPGAPSGPVADGQGLAAWLAAELGAGRFVSIGADLPDGLTVPGRAFGADSPVPLDQD